MENPLPQRGTERNTIASMTRGEVWCQDEARRGLTPIVRKLWTLRGHRPPTVGHTRDAWVYVYGCVRPATGQTSWLILPTVHTAAMHLALAECARAVGASADQRVLLVVDNAGWHGRQALAVPPGVEGVYLPAATPALQPAERVWPRMREAVASHPFATLDQLQDGLVNRCLQLTAQPERMRSATKYHWFPSCEHELFPRIWYHTHQRLSESWAAPCSLAT